MTYNASLGSTSRWCNRDPPPPPELRALETVGNRHHVCLSSGAENASRSRDVLNEIKEDWAETWSSAGETQHRLGPAVVWVLLLLVF